MTLRTRLTATCLLVVLVPLLIGAVLVLARFPATAAGLQARGLTATGGLVAAALAERCARVEAAAIAAGQVAGLDDRPLQQALRAMVADGVVDGLRVVDATGRPRPGAGTVVPGAADCRTGEPALSGGRAHLALTRPLDGPGQASVTAAITIDDVYARALRGAAGVRELVITLDGRVVAASGSVPDSTLRAGLARPRTAVVADGAVAVAVPVDRHLTVVVTQDRGWLPVSARWLLPLLFGGAALLATVIGSLLARVTTRPLEELGRAAAQVADGDLSTTLPVRSRDEVGGLAETFNTMTEKLRRHVEALRASRAQLQAGVERVGRALAGTHDLTRILDVVLDTALDSTGARSGAVLLRDGPSSDLVLAVGRELERHAVPRDLRVAPGEGVTGRVARSGTAVLGRTGAGAGLLAPAPGEPCGVPVVAVPLSSSDTVVGVLLLWECPDGEMFTETDLATLRTFAHQATVAVDNVLLHEEARRLSVTDGLTGLTNYRGFTMTVGREVERAVRFDRPLSLLLLDLDHFKLVNDVWGHQRGDHVLVELAARVRGQVRDVDVLARYGGEEFVVVLPETDGPGALRAAERICAAVRRRPFGEPGEPPIDVTLSVGVAVFPDHGTSATTLLRRADEALYAAKRGGRDTWCLATAEPAAEAAARPS